MCKCKFSFNIGSILGRQIGCIYLVISKRNKTICFIEYSDMENKSFVSLASFIAAEINLISSKS